MKLRGRSWLRGFDLGLPRLSSALAFLGLRVAPSLRRRFAPSLGPCESLRPCLCDPRDRSKVRQSSSPDHSRLPCPILRQLCSVACEPVPFLMPDFSRHPLAWRSGEPPP